MRFERSWHRSLTLYFSILIVIAIVCIEYINNIQHQYVKQTEQDNAREELSIVRSQLESLIASDVYLVNSLPAVIATHSNITQPQWDLIASNIVRQSAHISAIFLAPDNVIRFVYPSEGYQKLVGDRSHSEFNNRRTRQQLASLKGSSVANAMHLSNGNLGLVSRVPIYVDPPFNQIYWGACSVVIDLESLLTEAGVYQLIDRYDVAILSIENTDEVDSLIFGNRETFENAFTTEFVHFPNGNWLLAASTEKGFLIDTNWYQLNSARLIGYSALLMVSAAFFAVYRLYHKANERSLHDELTGLPNRRYFMFTLKRQFSMAKRSQSKEKFALLNIDLDKFKEINDLYGHDAGDKVLQVVGDRVQQAIRGSDVVARVGGDEFLVLLPRVIEEKNIQTIVATVLSHLCDEPIEYDLNRIHLQASIGYAMYRKEMNSVEDILKAADADMYKSKQYRKNH
ncbi:sensor domain-containing diguanylate cyclase [Vibrio kasasachensis]|uniref:sensor domain-containing diguanylate cyclase n=1 Tax=Vibrio kasasachensis TaxID=2910248 RepID=UPI003D139632